MNILNQNESALFIIDIQEKLLNAVFNKETVEKKSEILAKVSRILNIPTIVTEQYPKGLGETVSSIKNNLNTSTTYFEKTSFNALELSDVVDELKKNDKKQILVCGIETHICVYQTVVALVNAGFEVTVIADACGSRSEYEYKKALEIIGKDNVNIKTTEMVLFELIKGSKHPCFKEIQALIK